VWLMGRLFLRTMLFYSENLLVAFNLADGTVADANEMELTAIVTKNASRVLTDNDNDSFVIPIAIILTNAKEGVNFGFFSEFRFSGNENGSCQ